ncbi:hypothetical protein [Helicobacter pylori]|uniref:hypothetical protein n=1 Tax=Helicobacter pylori TaxID=210 RepID=UPI001E4BE679|nr:hypothetical protein [Helicobacter pylori]
MILETTDKQLQERQESLNKDYKKKLESIKEHSDRLENDLKTQFDAQLEKWEQNFKGYEQQLTDILEEKARLDLDKQRLNAQKQAFENQMKRREEEIKEENRNEIERLKKQKSDLHAQLDEMANETSALRQENRELNRKIDWQKDFDREKLEQDNRSLEKRKKELSATNENLKNRIQELENEKNKLDPRDERIKELEKEKRELEGIRAQREIIKQNLATLSTHNKALEAEFNQLDEKFENLKNRYAGVEDFEKRQKNIKEQIVKTNPKILGAPSNEVEELAFLKCIEKGMQEFNVFYPKRLLYMFHTALKSASLSPLSVLSGVSGTGKSELPKLYAHFGGLNFLSIAVQPTWDSPESLMGYFHAIENKFDATEFLRFFIQTTLSKNEEPYGLKEAMNMVLLDEMNLAHIELYFAEFLSKLEIKRSKETNISIKLGTSLTWELPLGN